MGKYFYNGDGRYTPSAILKEKTITENGTYEPLQDGADGYDSVTVNVEGGGSSDFSTAEVTIKAGEADIEELLELLPILESDGLRTSIELSLEAQEQTTKTIVLYKGKTIVISFGSSTVESTSGNITLGDDHFYVITGDCTITLLPHDWK